MERLTIENFLTIKKAVFEVKKISLIIGPQASGKSVIAKLLYFFKNFINIRFINSIQNFQTKNQIEKESISEFEQFFPKYTWADQEFFIKYEFENCFILISRKKQIKLRQY